MSVHTGDQEDFIGNGMVKQSCFYCGKRLSFPFVQWAGYGEELPLHPACCVDLFIRLMRDVHEIECRNSQYLHLGTEHGN